MAHWAYIDSSVVLRRLLPQSGAIPDLKPWRLFSSQILDVEVRRTLLRFHAERMLSAPRLGQRMKEWFLFRDAIDMVPLSDGILQRAAEPFPTLLRSLDAIHLATAMGWSAHTREPVTVLTHDERLGVAASACGFPVVP